MIKTMSKRTLALIIFLSLVTIILLVIALRNPKSTPTKTSTSPIKTQIAQTSLLFGAVEMMPSSSSAKTTTYSLPINIKTNGNKVTAVQLELLYDPEALTDIAIQNGSFFTNPVVLLNNIDEKTGRISYALGVGPGDTGKQGSGTLATLTFQIKPLGAKSTVIVFLPKTQVAAEGITQSVLKETNIAQINLGATPSPSLKTPKGNTQ